MKVLNMNEKIEVRKVFVALKETSRKGIHDGKEFMDSSRHQKYETYTTDDIKEFKNKILLINPADVYTFTVWNRDVWIVDRRAIWAVVEPDKDMELKYGV